jgi:hypothetical protein
MLNRDLDAERELVLEWRDVTPTRVLVCETLTGTGTRMTFKLPSKSYTVVQLVTT